MRPIAFLVFGCVLAASPGGVGSNAVAATTLSGAVTGPTIAAVGDIACDPLSRNFNAGAGGNGHCQEQATASLVAAGAYNYVLALGDLQYDCGSLSNFLASYDLAWGPFSATIFPVPGNHEYQASSVFHESGCTSDASGYYQYFAQKNNPNAAANGGKGYYSYTIGSWHVIALNSNCIAIGGCTSGSPENTWLQTDLAAHPATCTMAYWHHAPWSSKGKPGGIQAMRPIWAVLANADADLVLVGHFHHYERFADMNATGTAVADGTGMREIVAGTGGEGLGGFNTTPLSTSQIRNSTTFGILSVTLGTGNYSWNFIPATPGGFSDAGTDTCH